MFACLLGSGLGLALGVILCGTPFLACMQLVMQRSRELAPHATQRNAGMLTACFAVGQLSGPLLAALSSHFSGGLQPALVIAGCGLLIAGGLAMHSPSAGRALCANADAATARR